MMAVELATCCVLKDPMSPASAKGYMVSFTVFYERGFSVPPHRFLYLLLQHYHLELHNLTPLGVLHIAAFMTLCEDYMKIDPHFDPCNYFFLIHRPHDLNVELTILRGGGHTQFCKQNQVLIACVPRIIYSTHMDI
jgi:hypothetical protein